MPKITYSNFAREEAEFQADPSLIVYTEETDGYTRLVFADADVRLPRVALCADAWVVLAAEV